MEDPQFAQTIVPQNLEDATLEIPPKFVMEHGSDLPKYVFLEVSSHNSWKVELKKGNGRVWLDNGWLAFVENFSIKCDYKLFFRWEHKSFFRVFIFDASGSEIKYTDTSTRTSQRVNIDQHQGVKINQDDSDDDNSVVILQEWPQNTREASVTNLNGRDDEVLQGKGLAPSVTRDKGLKRASASREASVTNLYGQDDIVLQGKGLTPSVTRDKVLKRASASREAPVTNLYEPNSELGRDDEVVQGKGLAPSLTRDEALKRASAFQTPNPHFIVIIRPAYTKYVNIPTSASRSYFYGRDNKCIYLNGPDNKPWPMKYSFTCPSLSQVRIYSGWAEFAQEYRLRDGDACVFELINDSVMAFNITLFQTTEEEVDMPDIPNPKRPGSKRLESVTLKRAKDLQCNKPSFTALFKHSGNGFKYQYIPSAHATAYLLDQNEKKVFLHVFGKTWPVKYYLHGPSGQSATLSKGWKDFAADNGVQEGDSGVFELLSQAPNHYDVTIVRAAVLAKPI